MKLCLLLLRVVSTIHGDKAPAGYLHYSITNFGSKEAQVILTLTAVVLKGATCACVISVTEITVAINPLCAQLRDKEGLKVVQHTSVLATNLNETSGAQLDHDMGHDHIPKPARGGYNPPCNA